jgi:phosphate transport system substrate-binding protein
VVGEREAIVAEREPGKAALLSHQILTRHPIYSKWFAEYEKLHPKIEIQYNPVGSGAGIREVTAGAFDFGASDAPMEFSQMRIYRAARGFDILHFPTVLGADVPIYDIPGVTAELKFTPDALAGIFLGKITKWNDPELTTANPDAKLPEHEIVVAYRSDGSGTTYIWTNYLAKVSEDWDEEIGFGTSVPWPVGVGGQGNSGVAAIVKQTPYTIGYVELAYAIQNKLAFGSVKNQAGNFVKADLESVTAAAASVAQKMPDDFRVSITNAPGEKAYPISSFTWLLVPAKFSDNSKLKAMKDFLQWMSTDGQKFNGRTPIRPVAGGGCREGASRLCQNSVRCMDPILKGNVSRKLTSPDPKCSRIPNLKRQPFGRDNGIAQ